jgi:hypothetical protein
LSCPIPPGERSTPGYLAQLARTRPSKERTFDPGPDCARFAAIHVVPLPIARHGNRDPNTPSVATDQWVLVQTLATLSTVTRAQSSPPTLRFSVAPSPRDQPLPAFTFPGSAREIAMTAGRWMAMEADGRRVVLPLCYRQRLPRNLRNRTHHIPHVARMSSCRWSPRAIARPPREGDASTVRPRHPSSRSVGSAARAATGDAAA